ncbi:MAG: hypothetical protein ACM3PP_04705 [Candidatus Saccharibacteria bacterium]
MELSMTIRKLFIGVLVIIIFCGLFYILLSVIPASEEEQYTDFYPIEKLNSDSHAKWALVKVLSSGITDERHEIITNYSMLKTYKDKLKVTLSDATRSTTPDNVFILYKNGEPVDSVPFDDDTIISYAGIDKAFRAAECIKVSATERNEIDKYYDNLLKDNSVYVNKPVARQTEKIYELVYYRINL